jgi:hypothetical protein|tara:strand:+ start:14193 stop:14360 length:168 start_codon:yes stop_codon:yes gene_type:complete
MFKTLVKDTLYIALGAVATVGYVSYKAGKYVVDTLPEDKEFIKDTYNQVKGVIKK